MNIRRRLFISHILMVVIPLVVSLVVFHGGLHLFVTLNEPRDDRGRGDVRNFLEYSAQLQSRAEKWRESPNIDEMTKEANEFNEQHRAYGPVLLIYRGETPVVDKKIDAGEPFVDLVAEQGGQGTFLGRSSAHVEDVGDYRVILLDESRFNRRPRSYRDVMFMGGIVSLVLSVFIILVTNRFLTQFVFSKILRAMDTLTGGVLQLRDGNLGFRINYRENDEFKPICEDFNKMASRLLESESARQQDEQSRKELIAGISHDLRTPLTSIKAYVEGIERGVASTPEAQKRYIDTIKNKADDLERIIESLFLFSKLDTGEFPYRMERTEIYSVVREIIDEASEEYANRGLEISLRRDCRDIFVNIDAAQMRNVLINVFENSVKYGRTNGGHLNVTLSEDGENAVIALSDDGPGVPADALDKLFDVFFRIDGSRSNPGHGSGLGLAISAKVVKAFGGSITAANAAEGGLSLTVRLPMARGGL
ncbi:MAG: HAMP domain-containing histidine kinase [Synergistaceae bacterium]|jgi:signal transduction histidine kinase|nr:HAMP domain-containing histidine kinase [Synergistaceae bacterium]